MGSGFSKKKKQAKILQKQFSEIQEKMRDVEVTGQAGNGLVTITLNGDSAMTRIKINPDCVDKEDIEGLEDLIKAAYEDASAQLQKETSQGLSVSGIPGLSGFGL